MTEPTGVPGSLWSRASAYAVALWPLLWREHSSPGRVAAALLLGFVVGCTPLFGVNLILCMALAWALRLHLLIVCVAAAIVSIPSIAPLIGWAAIEIGTYVATGHPAQVSRADFGRTALPVLAKAYFWAWLRGGAILGAALSVVVGGAVYILGRIRRAPRSST